MICFHRNLLYRVIRPGGEKKKQENNCKCHFRLLLFLIQNAAELSCFVFFCYSAGLSNVSQYSGTVRCNADA